ncbi:MAG: helix-turn-helix domain-containing protein [Nocardioidaceae bacterium]|nr:helix-turn-helix domain-containing protein [Nocardioidaceae bacterium]
MLRRAESCEQFPLTALAAQSELRRCVAALEAQSVKQARGLGASWADIAAALGVSRQAVQQRYGDSNGTDQGTPD